MLEGKLLYDESSGRYDVYADGENCYDGLHCGQAFQVLLNNIWVSTRIELNSNGWYCVGLKDLPLNGLTVKL